MQVVQGLQGDVRAESCLNALGFGETKAKLECGFDLELIQGSGRKNGDVSGRIVPVGTGPIDDEHSPILGHQNVGTVQIQVTQSGLNLERAEL